MGRQVTESHDFYCINCGNKGIPLARRSGNQREKFHRKKIYCMYCKMEINHIECRNQEEIDKFKEDFLNGVYAEEAAESIHFALGV